MTVHPGWPLALALVLLLALGVGASMWGRLGKQQQQVVAAVRAVIQLSIVSLVIVAALQHLLLAIGFVALMYGVGVATTARRTGVGRAWPWTALAMAAGVLPVVGIIFATRVAPFNGAALIPIAGIITGNMMTAHTLTGRRLFSELRSGMGTYEAGLSIGLTRFDAMTLVTEDSAAEALVPTLDQTRTVGLVTLPGAFIGVLLGGGSPLQAGAAQMLVLIGIMSGQAVTVAVAHWFIRRGLLLPPDLKLRLRP